MAFESSIYRYIYKYLEVKDI